MSQQQQTRTFSAAGSSKSLRTSGISGANNTTSSSILPPRVTDNALTSFYRLEIQPHSVLKWDLYDCSKDADVDKLQDILKTLLELRHAEYEAASSHGSFKQGVRDQVYLYNKTLWSTQYPKDGRGTLWIMRLSDKEQISKSLTFASSGEEDLVSARRSTLDRKLSKFEIVKTSGQVQLYHFFSQLKKLAPDDPASLCPQEQYAQLHKAFLRGIEDLFLSCWVWNQQQEEIVQKTENSDGTRATKADTLKVEEQDEDEEGAIEDASKQDKPTIKKDTIYWPKTSNARIVSRFRYGVIMQVPTAPSNAMNTYCNDENNKLFLLSLRCTQDQNGHLYIHTCPQSLSDLQDSDNAVIGNSEGVIAPDGRHVMLMERVNGLGWCIDKEGEGVQQKSMVYEEKRRADECIENLRKMMRIHGVDIDLLDENWILCESSDHVRFLWPSKLCFLKSQYSGAQKQESLKALKMSCKPVLDLGDRAKNLIKEALGIATDVDVEDSIMLDDEERRGGGDDLDKGDLEVEADDADIDLDSEDERKKKKEQTNGEQETGPRADTDQSQTKEETDIVELNTRGMNRAQDDVTGTRSPSIVSKVNDMNRDDDETDLWGTFGFGPGDIGEKGLNRHQSATGLDEGGFGLITEDDFSFFDEATLGGGGIFHDMDVDLQPQDEILQSVEGDTLIPPVETDNISDINTTNSTLIDHPSLPGFTPGSLSATSPAVGGLNAKTPRTPFSPSQDLVDDIVAIEGRESESLLYNHDQYSHDYREGHHNRSGDLVTSLQEQQESFASSDSTEKQGWTAQNRNDLLSKYEQGKYALLDDSALQVRNTEEDQQIKTNEKSRNRLQHRGRHLNHNHSLLCLDRNNYLPKLTFPLLNVRSEDNASDIDATGDGGMSDRSSLMEEDSEKDESVSSGESSEDFRMLLKERLKYLHSSLRVITECKKYVEPALSSISMDTSSKKHIEVTSEKELKPFLSLLIVNPQIYLVCSDKAPAETIPRILLSYLFSSLPSHFTKSDLAALLCSPLEAGTDIITTRRTSTALCPLSSLDPPKILIGCQGAITIMQSSALSYWERISLSPVSGPKFITALALHCGSLLPSWQSELLHWFCALQSTFEECGLGSHSLVKEGLLGIGDSDSTSVAQILAQATAKPERWSDTLESLLSRLETDLKRGFHVVIYTINLRISPEFSWIYPRLRTDLRNLANKRWGVAHDLINIWPMAWSSLSSTMQCVPERNVSLSRMALSIYDSIQIPIAPNVNMKKHLPYTPSTSIGVQYPYFTLLPSIPLGRCNTNFTLEWNAEPYNLLDSGLLLHVGYSIGTSIGELTLIAIMDEKAQGYHINGWRRKDDLLGEIEIIWKEVVKFAKSARILWRIVICKEGVMSMQEIQHWSFIIKRPRDDSLRAVDITLTCLDLSSPMTLVLPRQNQAGMLENIASTAPYTQESAHSHFINADQRDYAIYPPFRIDYSSSLANDNEKESNDGCVLALQSSSLVSISNQYNGATMANDKAHWDSFKWSHSAPHQKWIHIVQIYKTGYSSSLPDLTLLSRIRIVTENFHKLTFVAKERLLANDNLPWHITVLDTARRACHLF